MQNIPEEIPQDAPIEEPQIPDSYEPGPDENPVAEPLPDYE